MYLDTSSITIKGKTYTRCLLRESYRQGKKVKHNTVANLSNCSEEEIAAIRLALRHKKNLSEFIVSGAREEPKVAVVAPRECGMRHRYPLPPFVLKGGDFLSC